MRVFRHMKGMQPKSCMLSFLLLLAGCFIFAAHGVKAEAPLPAADVKASDVAPKQGPVVIVAPRDDDGPLDGHVLYAKAFELIRDSHLKLIDPAVRQKWAGEWEHKFDSTGELDTEAGADRAVEALVESVKAMEGPTERFDMYLTVDKAKDEANKVQPSSHVGVGINFTFRPYVEIVRTPDSVARVTHNQLIAVKVLEGGPAENLVKPGDVLTSIGCASLDLKDTSGCLDPDKMAPREIADAITGQVATDVILGFDRTDTLGVTTAMRLRLKRADVEEKSVHFKDLGNGVAYIKIDLFLSQKVTDEMAQALTRAKGFSKLIIDLRGNRGGFTEAAVQIAGMILPRGTIFVTKTREGDQLTEAKLAAVDGAYLTTTLRSGFGLSTPVPRPDLILPATMPVVVLTDENTASASEILAGALKANKRAVTIGKRTFGKGVGQVILALPYGRILHVTIFQFFPGGLDVNGVGIAPDVQVDQDDSVSADRQLDAAVAFK